MRLAILAANRRKGGGGGGPSYGAELVTNGGFDDGTGWTVAGGESAISGGTFNSTEASSAVNVGTQAITLTPGTSYKVEFTVSNYVSGSVRMSFTGGTVVNGTVRTANGPYSETLVAASGNTSISIRSGTTGNSWSVDNVSVKEIL